jgi:O-antigen/teichoic acid export membrane protein
MLVPGTIGAVVIPFASQTHRDNHDIGRLYKLGILLLITATFSTLPIVLMFNIFADSLVTLLFGDAFAASARPVSIIVWSMLFVAIAQPIFSLMVAVGEVKKLTLAYSSGFLVSALGFILVVPYFGAIGAAWTAVARDAMACAVGVYVATRWTLSQKTRMVTTSSESVHN